MKRVQFVPDNREGVVVKVGGEGEEVVLRGGPRDVLGRGALGARR